MKTNKFYIYSHCFYYHDENNEMKQQPGKLDSVHTSEKAARRRFNELKWTFDKETGKSLNPRMECSADKERFTIIDNGENVETPELRYYIADKATKTKIVGCSAEFPRDYKKWCEKYHWIEQ